MGYNFITNLSTCSASLSSVLDGNSIGILYYSHIPTVILALLIGILVLIKNKRSLVSKALLSMTICFAIWSVLDLFTWLSFDSRIIMFAWASTGIFEFLIYASGLYFTYAFINQRDLPFPYKIILGIIFLPIIIMTPTTYNLLNFDYLNCWANTGFFITYLHYSEIFICIWLLFLIVQGVIKSKKERKKEVILVSSGAILFLLGFFTTAFISSYLTDQGISSGYVVESYGLLAMVIFIGFMAYSIVKFKAFNIKLLWAQALVWALIILVGSQFFYLESQTDTVKVLTGITLIISSILGLTLVRGIKKETSLLEELETANAGQKTLIHIMNHQIKGYLGKNKDIFAELLTEDYGDMPKSAAPLLKEGLEQTNTGVEFVSQILQGASAENGTLIYDMKKIDLGELLKKTFEKNKQTAEKKGLNITLNIDDGDHYVMGDEKYLGEAFRNLIDNSINYTPRGSININLYEKYGEVLVSIKDTGVGVKEEDRPRLFKAGGVGRDSIEVNVQSSGYGLVFVKGVIKSHNGKVWFDSEGEGKGTTFYVDLPKAKK